jgi:hypothetical protein
MSWERDEPEYEEICEECGQLWGRNCEHRRVLEREQRAAEADREATWWREVGGPLLGLPDESEEG